MINEETALLSSSAENRGSTIVSAAASSEARRDEEDSPAQKVPVAATNVAVSLQQYFLLSFYEFLLREDIPCIILVVALQLSSNYSSLLFFARDFGLEQNANDIYKMEWESRNLQCVLTTAGQEFSHVLSSASSFVPFL